MNYIINKHHRNVPDKVLLADLRKTAKRLGKKHVGYYEYEKLGKYSPMTLFTRFGGWNAALIKAGLKVKQFYRIPDEELIKNLKRIWDTLGRQPKSTEIVKPLSPYTRAAYARHFGSWCTALSVFVKAVKEGKLKQDGDKKSISSNAKCKKMPKGRTVKKINFIANKGMRFDVFRRDNYKCRLCGASPATDPKVTLHADHIIPSSKGGETTLKNLQTLCKDCNLGKAAKTINNEQLTNSNKKQKTEH